MRDPIQMIESWVMDDFLKLKRPKIIGNYTRVIYHI